MKLWIARDKDGYSQLFVEEPIKKNGYFEKIPNTRTFIISCLLFPEVTFENSPKEIELKLIGMKEDLCKSCENHWTDFPLPLEQAESHCKEDKDLLLRDLCGRLPYGVKCSFGVDNAVYEITGINPTCCGASEIQATHLKSGINGDFNINSCKPYLFPLSSMTEEQYNSLYESGILNNCSHSYEYVNPHIHGVSFIFKEFKTYSLELIEWLNKNHFDYRGLIPMGLAIDCTNLNIY